MSFFPLLFFVQKEKEKLLVETQKEPPGGRDGRKWLSDREKGKSEKKRRLLRPKIWFICYSLSFSLLFLEEHKARSGSSSFFIRFFCQNVLFVGGGSEGFAARASTIFPAGGERWRLSSGEYVGLILFFKEKKTPSSPRKQMVDINGGGGRRFPHCLAHSLALLFYFYSFCFRGKRTVFSFLPPPPPSLWSPQTSSHLMK